MNVLSKPLPGSSSSSSSSNPVYEYDVFLSFRGPDTRLNFTDHLYNALLDAGIRTFLDEEIDTGKPLKSSLKTAIESSRASIVVLSRTYASSGWCLEELVLILAQMRNSNQIVIPIFFHVEPTDVRNDRSTFREQMAKHTRKKDEETDAQKKSEMAQKIKQWEKALTEFSELKGKNAKNKKETELIKEVIYDIRRLGAPSPNTLPFLIGMEDYIQDITSWLTVESCHSGNILTIVGIGGSGKTPLAKYVFMKHSEKFLKSSFIEGINKACNGPHSNGLLGLQKKLYVDISKKSPLHGYDVLGYTREIQNVVAHEMVFIVLDDIGDFDQLDALLGNIGLYRGSKILITTNDASLTERCALFELQSQVQPKHKKVLLKSLHKNESLELLCFHAFKSHKPKEGYEVVSEDLVKYCGGYPFALQELGKKLYRRDVAYCKDYIEGLKKAPHFDINKTLKLSLDSLQSTIDEDLFKHIACYFVGTDKDETETILNACGIQTTSGIKNLTDRCLLSIGLNNKLEMPSLIQEMGIDLARKEYYNNGPSLLCCHEESLNALEKKNGTENIVGLALDMKIHDKKKAFVLQTKSLRKMCNLKLLQLNNVELSGSYKKFPKKIRWLCMHGFPSNSVPSDLPMKNLVVLNLSYSSIRSFGSPDSNPQPRAKKQKLGGSCSEDKQLLGSLKILDLSFCKQLQSLGGFFELPALEKLSVRNCISLIKVCELVEQCVKLVHIDLSYCDKFRRIPISIEKLKVEKLLLDGCNFCASEIEMHE